MADALPAFLRLQACQLRLDFRRDRLVRGALQERCDAAHFQHPHDPRARRRLSLARRVEIRRALRKWQSERDAEDFFHGDRRSKVMKLNRHHSLFKQGRLEESLAEHRALMQAIAARDAAAAVRLMREHFASGLEAAS